MQLKQSTFSLVLLLSYSLGFAHNLLPHCSNPDQFSHSHHQSHEHHSEELSNEVNDEHIAHDNHEDEGFYDFFLCLLSEVDHHYHYELNTDFTFSKISQLNLDFLKVKIDAVQSDESEQRVFTFFTPSLEFNIHQNYSIPFIGHQNHRGPPYSS